MALAYRYTKNQAYLDAAKRSAHYFMANVALNDYIPLLDSGAEGAGLYDTTAGACAACGLLELSEHVGEYEKPLYVQSALRCLKAVQAFCEWDPDKDSILDGGSARYDRPQTARSRLFTAIISLQRLFCVLEKKHF